VSFDSICINAAVALHMRRDRAASPIHLPAEIGKIKKLAGLKKKGEETLVARLQPAKVEHSTPAKVEHSTPASESRSSSLSLSISLLPVLIDSPTNIFGAHLGNHSVLIFGANRLADQLVPAGAHLGNHFHHFIILVL